MAVGSVTYKGIEVMGTGSISEFLGDCKAGKAAGLCELDLLC